MDEADDDDSLQLSIIIRVTTIHTSQEEWDPNWPFPGQTAEKRVSWKQFSGQLLTCPFFGALYFDTDVSFRYTPTDPLAPGDWLSNQKTVAAG